jgi:hypothetical protein
VAWNRSGSADRLTTVALRQPPASKPFHLIEHYVPQ